MQDTPSQDWESEAGQIIRTLRESRGLSSDELGQAIGVSGGYIRNMEIGGRRPRLVYCQAIADFFEIPVSRIVGDKIAAIIDPQPAQATP